MCYASWRSSATTCTVNHCSAASQCLWEVGIMTATTTQVCTREHPSTSSLPSLHFCMAHLHSQNTPILAPHQTYFIFHSIRKYCAVKVIPVCLCIHTCHFLHAMCQRGGVFQSVSVQDQVEGQRDFCQTPAAAAAAHTK